MCPVSKDNRHKNLRHLRRDFDRHWVGNGFPVRTLFSYADLGTVLSPFLLLDYAGPAEFPPTTERRGVGEHPHRGFETVTIVYQGEVEHRDSSGGGGTIGPGDVQWMTAASGIVHEECHGPEFAARGGTFEMVQLWVNLPAKHKGDPPRYQGISKERIPVLSLSGDAGTARVIAGELYGKRGPAVTSTPIHLWNLELRAGSPTEVTVPDGFTTVLVVLRGGVSVNGSEPVGEAQVAVFEREGQVVCLEASTPAVALLLSGEPIDEPIVGHGPFVMNDRQEIRQAMEDYANGKMGRLPARDAGPDAGT
jgi:hypothetical protein